jgi:hypothetical protein
MQDTHRGSVKLRETIDDGAATDSEALGDLAVVVAVHVTQQRDRPHFVAWDGE